MAAKYLKGCDEIEVKINSLAKSRKIQARVDDMIGVEIIEQSKDKLLLKDMGGGGEDNFDSILKRVIFLLHTLAEESHKAIKAKDTDLEYLKDVELNINKFTEYCIRLLNKQNYPDTRKTAVLYCTVFLLEQLGDEYKKLVSYINDNKIKLNNNLIELYDVIFKYHLQMEQMFLKFSYEKAIELSKERDNIIEKIEHLLKTSKSNTYIIILKNYENITETIIKIMNELMNLN